MNENNKPEIFAHCRAGCNWRTVHYDDFAKSAAYIRQYPETEGEYTLEKGKEYKIFAPKNADGNFDCSIRVFYVDALTDTTPSHEISFANNDKYADSFIFRLLDIFNSDSSNEITIVYELAGVRYTETITGESIWTKDNDYLYIEGATDVLLFNSDATLVGEKGDKGDPYTLTDEDKTEIANEVLSHFTDVSKDWQTITFVIENQYLEETVTLTAVRGMTWREWIESDYENPYNIYIHDEYGVWCDNGGFVWGEKGNEQPDDVIIDGYRYIIEC